MPGDDGPSVAQLLVQRKQLPLLLTTPGLLLYAPPGALPNHCRLALGSPLKTLFLNWPVPGELIFESFFGICFRVASGEASKVSASKGDWVGLGSGVHGLRTATGS